MLESLLRLPHTQGVVAIKNQGSFTIKHFYNCNKFCIVLG
jgi:hypothetical protein